jgi:riboflavin-specific deaminase-like protein
MRQVEVTEKVWTHIQHMRAGTACGCDARWNDGEAAALALYGPLARRDQGPVTVAQIGQSLDGRVATVSGDARDVSGPDGLAHLHRMRALVDGVVVGVRTALHDTPRLTVRMCQGPSPARIVIDPRGRLPDDAPLFHDDGVPRIIVQAVDRPRAPGVTVIRLTRHEGMLDPVDIRDALRATGLSSLLVEGGGITIARFLEADLLTRLHVAIAPLLIGGGPQGLTLANPVERLAEARRPETRAYSLGSDCVFDCLLDRGDG